MIDYKNMREVALHVFDYFAMEEATPELAEKISIEANAYCHDNGFPEFIHGTKITFDREGLSAFVNLDFTTPDSNMMHRCVLTGERNVIFSE